MYAKHRAVKILIGFWLTVTPRPQLVPFSVSFTRDWDIAYHVATVTDKLYNTMPDLSDLVLFHSGLVRNFY